MVRSTTFCCTIYGCLVLFQVCKMTKLKTVTSTVDWPRCLRSFVLALRRIIVYTATAVAAPTHKAAPLLLEEPGVEGKLASVAHLQAQHLHRLHLQVATSGLKAAITSCFLDQPSQQHKARQWLPCWQLLCAVFLDLQ